MSRKTALRIKILSNELNRKVAELLKEDGEPSSGIQMRVLNFIHWKNSSNEPVYQKDIEHEFDIRRSTASGILQRMEKRELIRRKSCDEDNRLKAIFLTPSGQHKVKENICKLEGFDKQLIQGISEEELALFFRVIDQLSENSKKMEIGKEGRRNA
ncbi:MarR family transcriptional regulator [Enterococcus sp. BWB1-3]|uniref:MarR family winged helix-turn-helix transcriptional regulator n=1 Tax=unclassified Enterococcus TaxID=2608891 RepID=UPI00192277AD|nr:MULTISPECIES: MarR family transcriptional regulator [unclassified Enterococcus]MBL1229092.1 MarR family transcriptional regulator [Enterococcus sp. BWB1-3]MCB5953493.1 MarR family transcriptional regulator [Enterococcus sp. CWB-B31]